MEAAKPQTTYIWGLFNGKQFTTPTPVKELQGKGIVKVSSGGNFFLALAEKGSVFGWGAVKYHRFGIVSAEDLTVPKMIPLKVSVKAISAGNWHSMLIDYNGKVWACGHNKQGACGIGTFQNIECFTEVKLSELGKSIACGDSFSLIISVDNDLFSCGHGQLHGHKSKDHLSKPKKLNFQGQKIKAASAGFSHSLAATQKGVTYSWGSGNFFQLGHGNKQDQKEPKLIKKLSQIKIVQVSCTRGEKNAHSMAVSDNGAVFTWGAGYKGKLGHQTKWTHENQADQPEPRLMETIDYKVAKVSAGGIHSNILNEEGEVLSFGCGSDGRLGHQESKEYTYLYREGVPKRIDSLKGVFVTELQSSYYHNICLGYKKS